jgi:hypothetical protein
MIKSKRMGGVCNKHGEMRNVYNILVGKLERKGVLERSSICKWKDNIKIDLRKKDGEFCLDS